MSFQFFALCKCRSCSISIVILVWYHSKQSRVLSYVSRVVIPTLVCFFLLSSEYSHF
jgi:hypothetical protein